MFVQEVDYVSDKYWRSLFTMDIVALEMAEPKDMSQSQ